MDRNADCGERDTRLYDDGLYFPEELMDYAERYGHPEEWIKKAQELHGKVERLEAEKAALRKELESNGMDP
jgi:hypothetical protein